MSIDETCSCGARFLLLDAGAIPTKAFGEAEKWRTTHVHNRPEQTPTPSEPRQREGDFTSYPVGFVKEDS